MKQKRKIFTVLLVCIVCAGSLSSYFTKAEIQISRSGEIGSNEMRSEVRSVQTEIPAEVPLQKESTGKIDLNKANSEQLQAAPGIGPGKAAAIIKYREEYGDFSSVDELIEVSGIGEKTLAKIRDYYCVN